jgi:hypothetical protein
VLSVRPAAYRLERGVLALIELTGKPMTFAAMRDAMETKLRRTFDERSLRRALHRLTDKCMLIAAGNGGPGDPLRYFVHPLRIGMMEDKTRADALRAALEADPDSDRAAAAWMAENVQH